MGTRHGLEPGRLPGLALAKREGLARRNQDQTEHFRTLRFGPRCRGWRSYAAGRHRRQSVVLTGGQRSADGLCGLSSMVREDRDSVPQVAVLA
jgi:hypothetical protein